MIINTHRSNSTKMSLFGIGKAFCLECKGARGRSREEEKKNGVGDNQNKQKKGVCDVMGSTIFTNLVHILKRHS